MAIHETDYPETLVLLVEDNERNARLMGEILRGNGYQLALAMDGQKGIDMADALLPQLILMDLQLPVMDGLSATRALKANPRTRDIPVVAVTAHAMPEHCTQLLEAGCCAYISKPISYRPFLDQIAGILARSPANPTSNGAFAAP